MTLHALIASSSPSKFFGFKSREDGNPGFQGLPEVDYTTPEGQNLPPANAMAISGDSQWLVVGSTTTSTTLLPYRLMLFRRRGDVYKFVTAINPGTLTDVTINYNGTIIGVSGGSSSTYRIIRRNGLTLEPILASRATGSNVYVSPNGKWYGILNGTACNIRKIDASDALPETVLPGIATSAINGGMTFSPDGRYVAIQHNTDRKTRIYELFEGTSVLVAELQVSATHTFQWYQWNEEGLWVSGFTAAGTSTASAMLSKLSFENNTLSLVAQGEFDMSSSLWLRTSFMVSHDGSFCIAPMRSNPAARYYSTSFRRSCA
ncbi:WD40 repeat protein [Rhizobium rosettiformans]|uniref:WD40 repeat domain-containing protein n=2 Tax=Rhizobium rosettiformans TaxID=1368430 RepID=A0A4S8Q1G5_9HYPH|nr:PD40 domain-containing protein [Rhizobium rosettiformans]MBB5276302.1 WD40 repeat protein [Rhizobium rosettiformans]THV36931.1 hypothetical protein FAA86_10625 [Rhizobium rosettiformans W3]